MYVYIIVSNINSIMPLYTFYHISRIHKSLNFASDTVNNGNGENIPCMEISKGLLTMFYTS